MTRQILLFPLFLIALASMAQEVDITSEAMAERIWMLKGQGGNMAVLAGEDGAMLIDDQFAPLTEQIQAKVEELCGQQVSFVINTHWHGDHTGGNENLGEAGAVIVAHRNVRKRMSAEHFNAFFDRTTEPSAEGALPVITFNDEMTFHWNGEEVRIVHVRNAHTDGDAMVWFKTSNVLHMGDCWFNGLHPYIDRSSGGSFKGAIKAVDYALSIVDEDTRIIAGNGPAGDRAQLLRYREGLKHIETAAGRAIRDGKSLEEIVEMNPMAAYPDLFSEAWLTNGQFLQIVFEDLSN